MTIFFNFFETRRLNKTSRPKKKSMQMYPPKLSSPPGGPFTLFAPVDAAFDKFAGKAIGKKEATQIVNKHLVRI